MKRVPLLSAHPLTPRTARRRGSTPPWRGSPSPRACSPPAPGSYFSPTAKATSTARRPSSSRSHDGHEFGLRYEVEARHRNLGHDQKIGVGRFYQPEHGVHVPADIAEYEFELDESGFYEIFLDKYFFVYQYKQLI